SLHNAFPDERHSSVPPRGGSGWLELTSRHTNDANRPIVENSDDLPAPLLGAKPQIFMQKTEHSAAALPGTHVIGFTDAVLVLVVVDPNDFVRDPDGLRDVFRHGGKGFDAPRTNHDRNRRRRFRRSRYSCVVHRWVIFRLQLMGPVDVRFFARSVDMPGSRAARES